MKLTTSIRNIGLKFGIDIRRVAPEPYSSKVVSLMPASEPIGNVLLSYVIEPFLLKPGEPISNAHTHDWESFQIAQTFLELEYAVDVIDYRNYSFTPRKHYSYFVGARTNFERIAKLMNKDCIKVVHLDTAHWIYNNYATHKRLMSLVQRRGITVKGSSRLIEQNSGIEYADYATILGNEFTIGTYSYARKSIFRIPISTCAVYPWDDNKDFESFSKNFLWFGSAGAVHRGLDMLLEIFPTMPDHHLYIGGPIEEEKDFVQAYYHELYQTPNIHMIGWLDVNGARFAEIFSHCVGIVFLSCAEGGAGSVINCMHAGLIPIITYQTGVDVDSSYGIMLSKGTADEIKHAIQSISGLPVGKIRDMSRKAWEFARANHTRERFAEKYREVIEHIMSIDGHEHHVRSVYPSAQLPLDRP